MPEEGLMPVEVQEEATNPGVGEGEVQAPETPEARPESADVGHDGVVEQPEIALGPDGELTLSDAVLDEMTGVKPDATPEPAVDALGVAVKEPTPEEQLNDVYSVEDLAKAFMDNTIDASKIPPQMREYHQAIIAEQARREELQAIARPPLQPQQLIPPPPPPPQAPQVKPLELDANSYQQLKDGARGLAAKYLGINPKQLDEFNPDHTQALQVAANEIRQRADQIQRDTAQQQYAQQMQQHQRHVQAYTQQQQYIRQQTFNELVTDFKKNPNWKDIDTNFYPQWFGKQDPVTQKSIERVMGQGNVDSVKKVMDVVFRAYEAQKKPSAAAPKAKPKAPAIMSASNEADFSERRGVADVSKLGEMSEEQRTQWFIQNRFV